MKKKKKVKHLICLTALFLLIGLFSGEVVVADEGDIISIDFEEEDTRFTPRGESETLTRSEEEAKEGEYSLAVTDRNESWNGPSLRIENEIELSQEYIFSVWVRLIEDGSSELQLSTQIGEGDSASYQTIDSQAVSSDEWVQLEGTFRYDSIVDDYISVYVESNDDASVSFRVDEFTMSAEQTEETVDSETAIHTDLQAIKDVYEDDFLIGNAVSMTEMEGQRLELLSHHHNLVTAENAMKPEYAYDSDRNFDFTDQQTLINRIEEEDILLHGHVLVWHQQSPEWLHTEEGELLSREEALVNMENHIEETILQYGDSVISWDVVNEAMNDNPVDPEMWRSMLRGSEWFDAIGDDYLELAFLKAREVLDDNGWHDVKLYYNDYNDDNQNKATAIYHMVKEINENYAEDNPGELLIDGVGMQGHYNLGTSVDNVRQSIERFEELGVEIGVTELDITTNTTGELSEEDEINQGIMYAELFALYKEYADTISRVTFWGLNDATSWRAERSPLLFNRDLQPKKAYEAVIDPEGFLEEYASEQDEVESRRGQAHYGTPTLSDDIDELWSKSEEFIIDRYQLAWQGASGTAQVLWDEDNLYVLVKVEDSTLDTSSDVEWEQDSVEVFIEESSSQSSSYEGGDGHFRLNVDGDISYGDTTRAVEIESHVTHSEEGYTAQLAIPWESITPEVGEEIGFDLQINDAEAGNRESVATWNDLSGQGFQDPSVFGTLEFVQMEEEASTIGLTTSIANNNTIIIVSISTLIIGGIIIYMRKRKTKTD